MKSAHQKLVSRHPNLLSGENCKVNSHVQRQQDDWYINTLMIDGIDTPFKYKRKKLYRSLKGQRVNLSYYMTSESIAGFNIDYMAVVSIKVS
jgi:hypothetical protein